MNDLKQDGAMSKRGRPFEPGNKLGKGRPPGSPNKTSLLLQKMLLDNGLEIVKSVIEDAKKGDPAARKLCMERLIPRLKNVPALPIVEADQIATRIDTPLLGTAYLLDDDESAESDPEDRLQ